MPPNTDNKREAGDETPSPSKVESKPKAQRFHVVRGIPHRVLSTHFDQKHNCVIDVVEHKKIVKNRKGDDVEIILERHMRCADEAIQAKYARPSNALIPIEVDNG